METLTPGLGRGVRIAREYAQPLDVEALARGARVSVTKPIRNREAPVAEPQLE
jgi:hypothetical protein